MFSATAPLFLIGYRGTGKTTVAQRLAERLEWKWIDADQELQRRLGRTIRQVFDEEGEAAFRDYEEQVVADLCTHTGTVVALGGGAVLRETTRQRLAVAGPVVYLTASPDTLAHRIAGDAATAAQRPNLTGQGGRAEIEQLLAQREPIYQQCATLTVDTEHKSPDEVAVKICAWLTTNTALP